MAAITKTPSNTWKAVIRKRGWPTTIKTFRTKRDAEDWARRTEDEMVRGVYINRAGAEKLLLEKALDRYLSEVSASKRESTAYAREPQGQGAEEEVRRLQPGRHHAGPGGRVPRRAAGGRQVRQHRAAGTLPALAPVHHRHQGMARGAVLQPGRPTSANRRRPRAATAA